MIKKKIFLLAVLGLVTVLPLSSLKAESVDSTFAMLVAQKFYQTLSTETLRSNVVPSIAYKASAVHQEGARLGERVYYYIVNMGQDGYVIVSGDNRVSPVLAYSTTSSFDGRQLPPNMASLLDEYQRQIEQLCDYTEMPAPEVSEAWESMLRLSENTNMRSVVVAPLVTSKWRQKFYYNSQCPADPRSSDGHASAGCTAVAMGQIIRYWHSPVHGIGSHSYVANNSGFGPGYGNYGTLSVDFSSAFYDYDNMPDTLSAYSTQTEVDAVATLLYHCGVSLDMMYGVDRSSAEIAAIDDALRNYFGYENPYQVYRGVYTEQEWLSMMKEELNHWRPMVYTGAGPGTVHAFVCDGYDNRNFFHMNWGWGGYADGFFLLTDLSPTLSTYNTSQTAIVNIVVNPPALSVSKDELVFFESEGAPSEIQRVEVQAINVQDSIQLSLVGGFGISSDSVTFGSQLNLPATGGTVYVKYYSGQSVSVGEVAMLSVNAAPESDSVRLVGLNYVPDCDAPLSLSGAQGKIGQDTNRVLLTWQAPPQDITSVSWDSVPHHSVGGPSPYAGMTMHRMEEIDLLPYHHHRLTHVSFVANADVTEYRILVYKGGGLANHGTQLDAGQKVVDQSVNLSELTMGVWNTVALDTPVEIDASQELWYGIYLSAPGGTSAFVMGGSECVNYKGDIFGYEMDDRIVWASNNENFVLKAVIENPVLQYGLFRDGDSLAVVTNDTFYADYPPAYGQYEYEVKAVWFNQCENGISQTVDFSATCLMENEAYHVIACDSFVWKNNVAYFESGDYLHEYYTEEGCRLVDTLYLTVNHSYSYTDTITACDSLRWINGETYYESISGPTVYMSTVAGCDSVITLHLIVVQSTSAVDSVVACDTYTWINGETYTESTQTPVYVLENVAGCDSVVNLHLTILHSSASVDSVVACDSYTWINGETYTESTQTPVYVLENAAGCDSTVTLHLTILQSTYSIDSIVSCQPYTWINGQTYSESTDVPTYVYENSVGCDSVVNLHLTILQAASYIDTIVACDSYTWLDGQTYTESISGVTVTFTDVIGCENATVTLDLTILHSSFSEDIVTACDSFTWVNDITYTESTNLPVIAYTSSEGCDSVVNLRLTIVHSVMYDDEREVCDSLTWINGVTYTESIEGPTMIYTNSQGCDSVVTLHLIVNHSSFAVDSVVSSGPYTWIDGNTYSESVEGPIVVIANAVGCDSVITLHLDIEVSVGEYDMTQQLKVYPNPTNGMVKLQLPQEMTDVMVELRLYDMYGKLLQRQNTHTDHPVMDLSNYAQGMYFIQVYQQNQLIGSVKISKIN